MEGLGDAVEKVIKAIIPEEMLPKDCNGCAERKKRLNKLIPFKKMDTPTKKILTRSKRTPRHD